MTISQRDQAGLLWSVRGHVDAQVMVWSRRRVIAVLQAPRIAGLVEAEGRGKRLPEGVNPQSCEKRLCRLKISSGGKLGPPASSWQVAHVVVSKVCLVSSIAVTERDGNNGTRQGGSEAGQQARCVGCGRTWWQGGMLDWVGGAWESGSQGVRSLGRGRAEALAEGRAPGCSCNSRGVGQAGPGAQAQQEPQDSRKRSSHR